MKSIRRIVLICTIFLFLIFVLLVLQGSEEVEVYGWEFNISRNLNHYIEKDRVTGTILPEGFCDRPSLLVIFVTTSPKRIEARKAIRETWGKERKVLGQNVPLYFLMGQTTDSNAQLWVEWESNYYGDIIQEDFIDTYNNLTLKSATMLKLFNLMCSKNSRYLLKIDDDMYLGLPRLVSELIIRNETDNLLMGSLICGAKPIRNYRDKWYAPTYLVPETSYPKYMSGTCYLMSGDVAKKIFASAFDIPIIHLEDVYFTGVSAKNAGVTLTHNPLFTFRPLDTNFCLFKQLITMHYQSPKQIRAIYEAIRDPATAAKCEKSNESYKVHRWMVDNTLPINKKHRRRECS